MESYIKVYDNSLAVMDLFFKVTLEEPVKLMDCGAVLLQGVSVSLKEFCISIAILYPKRTTKNRFCQIVSKLCFWIIGILLALDMQKKLVTMHTPKLQVVEVVEFCPFVCMSMEKSAMISG